MTKYWQIIKSFCKTKLHVKKSLTNLLNSLKSRTEIDKNTCLCQSFGFYDVKKEYYLSKRKGKYFYTFNHFYSEKSSKDQNSTNHLLWTLICRHKPAIIPKWINSLETNFLPTLTFPCQPLLREVFGLEFPWNPRPLWPFGYQPQIRFQQMQTWRIKNKKINYYKI